MRASSDLTFSSFLVLALSLARTVSSASTKYERQLSIVGSDFFEQFNWESENDPTNGRVNYLTLEEAKAKNLSYGLLSLLRPVPHRLTLWRGRLATGDKFFMLPDSKNVVASGSRGRDSIRITSKQAFDESVIIIDLEHMPYGCATWPAFWTLSQKGPWPTGGEIDIIEVAHLFSSQFIVLRRVWQGVNEATQNLVSLHTLPGCTMPAQRQQLGQVLPSPVL